MRVEAFSFIVTQAKWWTILCISPFGLQAATRIMKDIVNIDWEYKEMTILCLISSSERFRFPFRRGGEGWGYKTKDG